VFRKFWHHRAFTKDLEKAIAQKDLDQSFKVRKINVILDASLGVRRDLFMDLDKIFSIPQSSISYLVFPDRNSREQEYVDIFNKKDITFFGKFKDGLNTFCTESVDLQINYFNEKSIYHEWVACSTSKKMSIGFFKANQDINDLILDIDPTNTELFKKELVKYLSILKKI